MDRVSTDPTTVDSEPFFPASVKPTLLTLDDAATEEDLSELQAAPVVLATTEFSMVSCL